MEHPYSVKNYKPIDGHDGQGFTLTLCKNGKAIGTVFDSGWGGAYEYRLEPGEEQAFYDYANSLPPVPYNGGTLPCDDTLLIEELLQPVYAELDRKHMVTTLNRWSKTKTVFTLPGDKKDEYRTLDAPYSDATVAYLAKQYGGQGVLVWNPAKKDFDVL